MDVRNWKINKHTSDLWCLLLTSHLLYELIDEFSDLTLVVRVVDSNSGSEFDTISLVSESSWVDTWWELSSWNNSLRSDLLRELRWDLLGNWLVEHWWSLLNQLLLRKWHLTLWVWSWLHSWLLILLIVLSGASVLVLVVSSHLITSWLVLSLELLDEDLDEVHDVWSVEQVKTQVSWLLLGVVLPVYSVSDFLLLLFSLLLHLVDVNVELLSVKWLIVKTSFGQVGSIGSAVTNKGVESCFFIGEDLDALDSSEVLKEFLQFFSAGARWEVLYVEIASSL